MKKKTFIGIIIGIVGLTFLGLGMSMIMVPTMGNMPLGIIMGAAGLLICIISIVKVCSSEGVEMPKVQGKIIKAIVVGIVAFLLLGIGMSLVMIGGYFVLGILIGVVGIIVGISIIPMLNGFTD